MNWRLVDSDICEPAYSVASDEAMALARSRGDVPDTLHFYRRDRSTVSLGYFQKVREAVDVDFCRKNNIQLVRRVTGGSAIYTDRNHLIYGMAVGSEALPKDRQAAFMKVCSAITAALEKLGIIAIYKPVNDVLVGGRKISGSAQMRRWGIILQHGTIIMDNDPYMMTHALKINLGKVRGRGLEPQTYVTSMAEVLGKAPDPAKVKAALAEAFGHEFGVRFSKSGFTDSENACIEELIKTKYGLDSWNLRL
jgi:lipoate-protein ligase A